MGWIRISHPCKAGVMVLFLENTQVYAAAISQELATVFFPIIILMPAHICMSSTVKTEKETSGKENDYQIDVAHWP